MIWNDEDIKHQLSLLRQEQTIAAEQHESLGKVVEELTIEMGKQREAAEVRYASLDQEMTEMESRLMTRIEELEEREVTSPETDILQETEQPSKGMSRWSERKRARIAAESNPERWKAAPKPAPEEKKE